MATSPSEILEITEEPISLPAGLDEQFQVAAEVRKLYLRIANLQNLLEDERNRAEKRRRREIIDLLEIVDALDRLVDWAETQRNGTEAYDRLQEGLAMTRKLFLQKLDRLGVRRMSLVGREVDPSLTEIVDFVETESVPDETVIEELAVGYTLDDEVLRAAKVVISRHR